MTQTSEQLRDEMLKQHLLANFCDGSSWKDARADRFTHEGALDIAKYFYDLALLSERTRLEGLVPKEIEWEWEENEDGLGGKFNTCKNCAHLENDPESPHACEVRNSCLREMRGLFGKK